jgi:hypothetical protein
MALALWAMHANSQTPTNTLILAKGMTIESEIIGYQTPMQQDAVKWIKMKSNKKVEAVMQFNADIEAGKVTPTIKTPIPTKINEVTEENGAKVYKGTTRIGTTDYQLTIKNAGDTVRYMVNDGLPFPIPGKNNDTTGIFCFGVRRFPNHVEVGTYFPGYINEMNLFPYDLKTSRREYFNFSGGDGYSYSGFVNVRKTRTMQVNSISINMPFYVMAKEELVIDGKAFTAYKLLSEGWSKINSNAVVQEDPNHFFDDKYISDKIKDDLANRGRGWDTPERKAAILEKMQEKSGIVTNADGYMVALQENWYVPELGLIAKSRTFDATGALVMESRIVSIK